MVRWAAQRGEHPELGGPLDALWVIPVFRHAYAEKARLSPFEHRLQMCRLCFEGRGFPVPVQVLDVERTLSAEGGPSVTGTVDVVEHLQRENPDTQFGLLLGADTAADLVRGRWKRSETLLQLVRLVVVAREGTPTEGLRRKGVTPGPELERVSSTEARASRDSEALKTLVVPEVAAYIAKHRLYTHPDPG